MGGGRVICVTFQLHFENNLMVKTCTHELELLWKFQVWEFDP